MTPDEAIDYIMGDGERCEHRTLAAFQAVVDAGRVEDLPDHQQIVAQHLIDQGVVTT